MSGTLSVAEFDARAEENYPWIEWRKPIAITILGGHRGLGCRLCIARSGFRPSKDELFKTVEEFEVHMREKHERAVSPA